MSLTWYTPPACKAATPASKVIVADELFAIAPAGFTVTPASAMEAPLMNALLIVTGVLPEFVTMTCN
jgi:hypothetical protein